MKELRDRVRSEREARAALAAATARAEAAEERARDLERANAAAREAHMAAQEEVGHDARGWEEKLRGAEELLSARSAEAESSQRECARLRAALGADPNVPLRELPSCAGCRQLMAKGAHLERLVWVLDAALRAAPQAALLRSHEEQRREELLRRWAVAVGDL